MAKWKNALSTGDPWEDIFRVRRHDGQWGWFLSRAFPLKNPEGKITRWFGTNTDITESRQTQEALRLAQEQLSEHAARLEATVAERTIKLREAMAELETYSYSIADDMRAPLRAMQGFSRFSSTSMELNSEPKPSITSAASPIQLTASTGSFRMFSVTAKSGAAKSRWSPFEL